MHISNTLPPAPPNSARISNFSANLDQAGGNGPAPSNDDSQRIVNQAIPGENNVDLSKDTSDKTTFSELSKARAALVETANQNTSAADTQEKETKNIQEAMQERARGNVQLRSYRQAVAHKSNQQSPLRQPSEEDGIPNNSVTMYNQAITAYIKQDLFFDSINKIGLFVKV